MDASEYQAAAQRTELDQLKARVRMYGVRPTVPESLSLLTPVRLNHAVIGMMGELGEIAQSLERWVYYGEPLTEMARDHLALELGDVLWYLAEACNALGLDMGQVMERNVAKLATRYPDKYEDERARRENRDGELERMAALLPGNGRPADHPRPFGYEPEEGDGLNPLSNPLNEVSGGKE